MKMSEQDAPPVRVSLAVPAGSSRRKPVVAATTAATATATASGWSQDEAKESRKRKVEERVEAERRRREREEEAEAEAEAREAVGRVVAIPLVETGGGGDGSGDAGAIVADEDETSLEAFQRVPVASFGLGLLMGMGFSPESGEVGYGKRAKKVDVMEQSGRPALLGLGAKPKAADAPLGGYARRPGILHMTIGSLVRFVEGARMGKYAVVVQADGVPGLNTVRVESLNEKDELASSIVPRASLEIIPMDQVGRDHPGYAVIIAHERALQSHASSSGGGCSQVGSAPIPTEDSSTYPASLWLRARLVVKVVDPKSPHYKQKGVVVAVSDPKAHTCTLRMMSDGATKADGMEVRNVKQDALQTVLPKKDPKRGMLVRKCAAGDKETLVVVRELGAAKERALVRADDGQSQGGGEWAWVSYDDVCAVVV